MKDERYTRKEAVAITYNPDLNDAPKIVAKGRGKIAENILARAEEFNVPVQEDASLVELLGQLDINQSIPEELYQAVAEVFAYIYKIDKEKGNTIRSIDA